MKKILIALDYDVPAQKVAEAGYELAKSMNAQTLLLHVIADPVYYSSISYTSMLGYDSFNNMNIIPVTTDNEYLKKAANDYLEIAKLHLNDSSIQTMVKEGGFATSILEAATECGADIIVVGSHARHGFDKLLLGSIAEEILHKTTVPLFIIPTKETEDK